MERLAPTSGHRYGDLVPSMDDVHQQIAAMPNVTTGTRYGQPTWFVSGKGFAWERPFSKADIKRFGDHPVPSGPILAVAVDDLEDKAAVLDAGNRGVFTIAHFDNYPALLIQLDVVDPRVLRDAIVDAWLACAPDDLARAYLSEHGTD